MPKRIPNIKKNSNQQQTTKQENMYVSRTMRYIACSQSVAVGLRRKKLPHWYQPNISWVIFSLFCIFFFFGCAKLIICKRAYTADIHRHTTCFCAFSYQKKYFFFALNNFWLFLYFAGCWSWKIENPWYIFSVILVFGWNKLFIVR